MMLSLRVCLSSYFIIVYRDFIFIYMITNMGHDDDDDDHEDDTLS